jgi:O-antigen/teichoic acid export membrane protein
MTNNKFSTLEQSLLYGMSIALMKGISLLMLPFIARYLSPQAFGLLEVVSTLAVVASVVVGMGMEHTLFRFVAATKSPRQRRNVAAELFGLSLIIAIIAASVGWLISDNLSRLMPGNPSVYLIKLVLAMLALEGCIAIPLGWLRMNDNAMRFFMITCSRALLQAALVVLMLSLGRGVAGILEAGLIAALCQSLVLSYWHIRHVGVSLNYQRAKTTFIYSLPIVGSGLLAFVLNGLDRWIIAGHASLTDVAQLAIAAKFALASVLLLQPFTMWWSPRRFEVLNQPRGKQAAVSGIVMGACIALLVAVLVAMASPMLITMLFPAQYTYAGHYVVGLVLVMLVKELAELFNIGCFCGQTTKAQFMINAVGALIGGLAMFYLVPKFAVFGVIASLLLAQLLRLVLFYSASQYFLPLAYPMRALLLLTSLCLAWLLGASQITSLATLIVSLLLATLSIIGAACWLNLIALPSYVITRLRGI